MMLLWCSTVGFFMSALVDFSFYDRSRVSALLVRRVL
jgi:hypothetical protein